MARANYVIRNDIIATTEQLVFKQNCAKLTAQNYAMANQTGIVKNASMMPREHAQAFLIANVIFSTEVGVLEAKLAHLQVELKQLENGDEK